ncbi:MAG: M23 family metallopeptidase [Candidatus Pacebacteria bacterium]|nr:M23 family metallopeptidase [Candidatus Paceibacterota bacterium]
MSENVTTAVPVVLIAAMSAFNLLLLSYFNQSFIFKNISGTAYANVYSEEAGVAEGTLSNDSPIDSSLGRISEDEAVKTAVADGAYLMNDNDTLSTVLPTREGLMIYKVQRGDTVSRVAANFGITVNTILWANKNISKGALKLGQELTLLPVSGVLHQVQPEDTLNSIANLYSVAASKIIGANEGLSAFGPEPGETIVIPGGKPVEGLAYSPFKLPDLPGFFAIPTTGWNWGNVHGFNAVDIANVCGTPIYVSAEGLVIEESAYGWNGGYGEYVVVEHLNGTKTKYAHLQKISVSVGDYLLKGDILGQMGNTGRTDGPTGCHLHFEVRGAKNPFIK